MCEVCFNRCRQLTGVLKPHPVDGVLKCTMVHVLQALSVNHGLLLATLDVFVKEPLLDGQQFAKRVGACMRTGHA